MFRIKGRLSFGMSETGKRSSDPIHAIRTSAPRSVIQQSPQLRQAGIPRGRKLRQGEDHRRWLPAAEQRPTPLRPRIARSHRTVGSRLRCGARLEIPARRRGSIQGFGSSRTSGFSVPGLAGMIPQERNPACSRTSHTGAVGGSREELVRSRQRVSRTNNQTTRVAQGVGAAGAEQNKSYVRMDLAARSAPSGAIHCADLSRKTIMDGG